MVSDFFTNSLQGTIFTQNKGQCTQSAQPRERRRAQETVGKGEKCISEAEGKTNATKTDVKNWNRLPHMYSDSIVLSAIPS